jgi:hypothetical protein
VRTEAENTANTTTWMTGTENAADTRTRSIKSQTMRKDRAKDALLKRDTLTKTDIIPKKALRGADGWWLRNGKENKTTEVTEYHGIFGTKIIFSSAARSAG